MRQRRIEMKLRPLIRAGFLGALIVGLASVGALAQDYEYDFLPAEEPPKEGRTVLFTPTYVDVRQLQPVLRLFNADIEVRPGLNLIAVRTADEQEIETIRQIVETLDVAPELKPNIELTAYVLASSSGDTAAADIPAELGEAVSALEARFNVGALTLLDSIFLRVGDGSGGRVEGSFPSWAEQLTDYQFHFDSATVSRQEDTQVVRLNALTFAVMGENPAGVHRAMLRTDFEILVGEKAMVGKATPKGIDDTLILLIAAVVKGPQ